MLGKLGSRHRATRGQVSDGLKAHRREVQRAGFQIPEIEEVVIAGDVREASDPASSRSFDEF